jgi:PAS domain S-box-containing protein
MIYRFLADGTGCVCAESRAAGVRSFLDLHFPAGDIPLQARALYLRAPVRLVTQVDYQPAPLLPAINPRSGKPLDMSLAILRDVSPIHREYLRNMGVAASMSISIVVEGRLWGLIACHHRTPRRLPRHLRAVCEVFGSMFSLRLEARQRADQFARRDHTRSMLNAMLRRLAEDDDYAVALGRQSAALQQYVSAGGLVIHVHGGNGEDALVAELGEVPGAVQIKALTAWLAAHCACGDRVFATDRLGECYPEGTAFAKIGSGVLALSVSRVPSDTIIWFRPECVETVRWGGNPATQSKTGAGRLTPRASFEAWAETVRGRSLPWTETDIQAAADLRLCLMDIVLRRIESQHQARSVMQANIQHLELQNTRLELEGRVFEATRKGQEALARSEARFRAMFESGPNAMVLADADGAIEMTNSQAESLFGYDKPDLPGKPVGLLIPEFSAAALSEKAPGCGHLRPAAENRREMTGRSKDGTVLLLEVMLTCLETAEGRKIVASMSDIRGRLELEADLRQAQKMEAVGQLTAGVAHDFNNLLQTLVGSLELLRDYCANSECASLVETSIETAMRGSRLTHHLLAFSRKQMLRPSPTDVVHMLEKLLPLLARTLGPNICIVQPPQTPGLLVFADPTELDTCVLNLVLNARDAMPEGGCLTVGADRFHLDRADNEFDLPAGAYIRITIEDTGHGIPSQISHKVFDPFFTTKPVGKGSGLGLSMVMGFARQSGGAVKIDTNVGCGTLVHLILPSSVPGARPGANFVAGP